MIIERSILLRDYAAVLPFTTRGSSVIEVLKYVKFDIRDGKATLSATNMKGWIELKSDCIISTEDDVSILLPKQFFDIMKLLYSNVVEIKLRNNRLTIADGESIHKVSCIDADEFPQHEKTLYHASVGMSASRLSQAIKTVSVAMAKETSRPILCGINFKASGGNLLLSGMDGYIFSQFDMPIDDDVEFNVTIDSPELLSIIRDEDILLKVSDNSACIVSDDAMIISSIVYGDYPDISSALKRNGEYMRSFTISISELSRAISISETAGNEAHIAKFFDVDGALHVTSDGEIGATDTVIAYGSTNGDMTGMRFALNMLYLKKLISSASSESISFFVDEASSPVKITDGANSTKLIMPMHVED